MTRISARRPDSYHRGASARIAATCNASGRTAKQIADLGGPAPCRRNAGAVRLQVAGASRTRLVPPRCNAGESVRGVEGCGPVRYANILTPPNVSLSATRRNPLIRPTSTMFLGVTGSGRRGSMQPFNAGPQITPLSLRPRSVSELAGTESC